MAASSSKPAQAFKSPSPPGTGTTNRVSSFLERGHPGVRHSTPDSEALASSDDDGEQSHLNQTIAPASRPGRRTSWLNAVPITNLRKASLPAGGPLSPSSPGTDQSKWATNPSPGLGSSVTWSQAGGSSFPWSTGIWNSDSRKEPPPRLSELVSSPTLSNPPTSSYFPDELLSPTGHPGAADSTIPFPIPLHPTPKTYRSQSYSVGQLGPESSSLPHPSRARNSSQFSALNRRSSRPSLYGDWGHDLARLGLVREDDDDDGSGSDGSMGYSSQTPTYGQVYNGGTMRRPTAQLDAGLRDSAFSLAPANNSYPAAGAVHTPHTIQGIVPEESDLATEDLDGLGSIPDYNGIRYNGRRRFSEQSIGVDGQLPNHTLGNVRKAHWQTSLGFGSIADSPQSRRHSFVDIPLRPQHGDSQSFVDTRSSFGDPEEGYFGEGPYSHTQGQTRDYDPIYMTPLKPKFSRDHRFPEPYFRTRGQGIRTTDAPSDLSAALHQAYAMPNAFGRQQPGYVHSHPNQVLYLVSFKCHRADVFYVQEDTGLQVKPGDLVIVEADRGTDLGTVTHARISLQEARELKQQYADEHYKWLMMFFRQGQTGASDVTAPPAGLPGVNSRSAVGGMGPHVQHGLQDAADIKPKLIKRLAQNHEILTLRDKEGNEAKAKRVCQQKVVEHRLNMEILDAEFQMDWKKLTFYYFADTYINFNSLVTDLFKIYKTRIWMSAINPASFVTPPPASLPLSNSLYSYDVPVDRRHLDHRAYGTPLEHIDPGRDGVTSPIGLARNAYPEPYQQPFAPTTRQSELGIVGFAPSSQPQPGPCAPYSSPAYGGLEPGYLDAGITGTPRAYPSQAEWVNSFQGLSLNS